LMDNKFKHHINQTYPMPILYHNWPGMNHIKGISLSFLKF
jgi:hypothetical protein